MRSYNAAEMDDAAGMGIGFGGAVFVLDLGAPGAWGIAEVGLDNLSVLGMGSRSMAGRVGEITGVKP
jgi:hypothetical protein